MTVCKIVQMALYQHFTFKGPRNYTQIEDFGMKIYHLATLVYVLAF
jgi:hypothetical protein